MVPKIFHNILIFVCISVSAVKENRKDLVDFLIDEAGFNVNAFGEHLVYKTYSRYLSKKLDYLRIEQKKSIVVKWSSFCIKSLMNLTSG